MFIEIPANANSIANRGLIFGVGINDAPYNVSSVIEGKTVKCPFYIKWKSMLSRCYSESYQKRKPTYIGCSVCDGWLEFSNFKLWMQGQDWKGKHLDKDLLVQGNKVYSPKFCLFVSQSINSLLVGSDSARGKYPIGVSFNKRAGKYVANVNYLGVTTRVGTYNSVAEAFSAYKNAKYEIINKAAAGQLEPIRAALLNYIIKDT